MCVQDPFWQIQSLSKVRTSRTKIIQASLSDFLLTQVQKTKAKTKGGLAIPDLVVIEMLQGMCHLLLMIVILCVGHFECMNFNSHNTDKPKPKTFSQL